MRASTCVKITCNRNVRSLNFIYFDISYYFPFGIPQCFFNSNVNGRVSMGYILLFSVSCIFNFNGSKILSFSEQTEYLYFLIERYLLYFRSNFIVQVDLSFLEHIHVSKDRSSLRRQYYSVKYAAAETQSDAVP